MRITDESCVKLANRFATKSLQKRVRELGPGIVASDLSHFELMHDSGYVARAEAEVKIDGRPLGNGKIYAVLFRPGNGTGNRRDYQLNSVPANWTPRRKVEHAELFMAIGTGYRGRWIDGLNYLLLTDTTKKDERFLIKPLTVGMTDYRDRLIKTPTEAPPHFALTLDKDARVPYGDPHAVVFGSKGLIQKVDALFQVGAFLGFNEDGEDLERIREITGLGRTSGWEPTG